MVIHTNVIDLETYFIRLGSSRKIRSEPGVYSYDILRDTFRSGIRATAGAGDDTVDAPRTKPIEFWWEHGGGLTGTLVNKPMIKITPSNVSTDKVTVEITNWGDSDEQLYAVTPL
jgi:hypothetical protein